MSPGATRAFVALGSNLGDRRATLEWAVEALRRAPGIRVLRVSSWIETEPVGGPHGQPRFLNGVVELETQLAPRELLARLFELERSSQRVRTLRDGPRTLDLDLLLHGESISHEPELELPHPRMEQREFVLAPLAEIAPTLRLPGCGRSVAERLIELRAERARSS